MEIFGFVVLLEKFQNSEANCLYVLQISKFFIGITLYEYLWGKLLSKGFMVCYRDFKFYRLNSHPEFGKIFLQDHVGSSI